MSNSYQITLLWKYIYLLNFCCHFSCHTWDLESTFYKNNGFIYLHQWLFFLQKFFSYIIPSLMHSLLNPFCLTSSLPSLRYTGLRRRKSRAKENLRMRWLWNRLNVGGGFISLYYNTLLFLFCAFEIFHLKSGVIKSKMQV